ncbi:hypothetical protein PG994_009852 [Apiospora phragmitis]|uniref:Uncharacterized protein n=1 Tax=Apiospora phragmitis TaxID=2905665 RepID=A0ABR1TNE8_9PEZI
MVLHIATLAGFLGFATANLSLEFYEAGCPNDDSPGADGYIGGSNTDELWCVAVDIAHNVVATNIAQENMEFTLFSDPLCAKDAAINTFTTDGCKSHWTAGFVECTIAPWGREDSGGFFEALKTPNLTGTYSFATPNISAPLGTGEVTEEMNSALPGWSLSVTMRTGAPFRGQHYTAGEVVMHTPPSLLTNITDAGSGQKNVSVLDEWKLCIIHWDLIDEPYPDAMRRDDGTCSSVLSPGCLRDVQAAARRKCADPHINEIPACAKDDTRPSRTSSVSGVLPAQSIREFPGAKRS